jgi:poly-gamma-glutamate capsule biosynthesis protein CapA/YwtB (metallophosphatase superfamily)
LERRLNINGVLIALVGVVMAASTGEERDRGVSSSPPAESSLPTARLVFLGDTSFGENYQERRATTGGENVLESRGYDSMMANYATILEDAALVIANLETPVTDLRSSPLAGRKRYIHYADVQQTPRHLSKYGIDLVSIGNNHAMDMGAAGLAQSMASLAQQGISTCGGGENETQARLPYQYEIDLGPSKLTLALLCAFEFSDTYDRDFGFYASERTPGVNPLLTHEVASQVRALRRENPNVFVVAFPHWGRNYHSITANQRRLGRALVDAGLDLVIGHGAHLLQGLELYKGRWIVYGIGNFVFGSSGRYALFGAYPYSAIAELTFAVSGKASITKMLRLYPIVTDNAITDYRGRLVTGDEYEEVKRLLAAQSVAGPGFHRVVQRGRNQHGHYFEVDLN